MIRSRHKYFIMILMLLNTGERVVLKRDRERKREKEREREREATWDNVDRSILGMILF